MSHQLDRSGAPLALLDLGRALRAVGCSVQLAALYSGPLASEFQTAGIGSAREIAGAFDICIANTVLTARVVPELKRQIPVLAMWIHESPTYHGYNAGLAYSQIPADHVDQLLGVADFQVEALRRQFPDIPAIRFDNTFGANPQQVAAEMEAAREVRKGLTVCAVGSEIRRKGYHRLDEIFALGRPARPVHVILAGIDPAEIASFIAPDRVPPDVSLHATGRVPRDTVMRHIAGADVYLTLSEDDVKPLSVLEALCLQKPVIATDIPAHRELRAEFPHIVCTDRPLAHLWKVAAGRSGLDAGMAAANVSGLRRYGWEAFVERARNLTRLADGSGNFTPM